MTDQALGGLRVVELGAGIPAAYATKLLADLGADVIKVEPPGGDPLRLHGPFPNDEPHPETGALHLFLNANKRGVTADLEDEDGRSRLLDLARHAHLVIHNIPPRDMERLRIEHADLATARPDLVMVSITPFGYDTPHRDWRGNSLVTQAASGLVHRIGDPGREPLALPFAAADFQGGVHGAVTALAALRARRLTGRGQHAWIATTEIIGSVMAGSGLAGYVFNGQNRPRSGFHNPGFYPWQVAPVKDGFFEVITMVDDHWRRFVELMGDPEWAGDERLEDRWLSFQWADELDAYWHPWLAERTKEELSRTFWDLRIPFQPIHSIDEIASSEHLEARDFWVDVDHPVAGRYRALGAPYRLSATPWRLERPAPRLGEHNDEVAAEVAPPAPASAAAATTTTEATLPMQGLRVLDHGHVWAGPLLGQMLADLGAEVIKVRAPDRTSGIAMGGRSVMSMQADAGDPRTFHGWDRGKLGISLNLASVEGRGLYLRLVEHADVVIENFAPRVMPSLALDYAVLAAANPRLIMASLSATGATEGPWRDLVTYGPSLSALYGIKSLQGYRGDPRPREDTADLDPTSAAHAFVAVCAALEYRERSGRGQHIDLAQGEATLQRIAEPLLDYLLNDRVASTQGNRYPGVAPHGIYPAAGEDCWLALAATDEAAWDALLALAGDDAPGLLDDRFATIEGRLADQDALDEVIAGWTRTLDATAAAEALQHAGVAASPVMDPPLLLVDENYDALRRAHVRVETEADLTLDQIYQTIPWKLPETPGIVRLPAPALDEHNAKVYGALLGLGGADLEGLRKRGVI